MHFPKSGMPSQVIHSTDSREGSLQIEGGGYQASGAKFANVKLVILNPPPPPPPPPPPS